MALQSGGKTGVINSFPVDTQNHVAWLEAESLRRGVFCHLNYRWAGSFWGDGESFIGEPGNRRAWYVKISVAPGTINGDGEIFAEMISENPCGDVTPV